MAQMLAHHGAVLALDQRIVVALPGPALGLFDVQFLQQPGNALVDGLRAVVTMEPPDDEGEGLEQLFQCRQQIAFRYALDADHDWHPGHRVDRIEVIKPLDTVLITLVNGFDPQEAGTALGVRDAAFTDRALIRSSALRRSSPRFYDGDPHGVGVKSRRFASSSRMRTTAMDLTAFRVQDVVRPARVQQPQNRL